MMVLQTSGTLSSASTSTRMASRRLRSKGTIAGFGSEESAHQNVGEEKHDASLAMGGDTPYAWLALVATQTAVNMGPLALCPPGKSRRALQQALSTQRRAPHQRTRQPSLNAEMMHYFGVDKLIREAPSTTLNETVVVTDDEKEGEDASSGDEDELRNLQEILSPDLIPSPSRHAATKDWSHKEPLYSSNPSSSGKLPFCRRKLKFFDDISATDSHKARQYLQTEARNCKRRQTASLLPTSTQQQQQLPSTMTPLQQPITPSMAAALVIESLSLNPKESLEGMAKCYDGIVAAGMALLDSSSDRSAIMAALEPLLVTSLEPVSGEGILQLAKLRQMCATRRYQQRFVQRIAPCLVRPPNAAIWCLQHQNDMECILAAVEMILEGAPKLFSKNWHERGQFLLRDSARRETLNSAAEQLKHLSSVSEESGLVLSGHGGMRRLGGKSQDIRRDGSAGLAEWEVIAVDRQIRISISNILSQDWSRVAIVSRDVEMAPRNRRPSAATRSRSAGESSPSSTTPVSPQRTTPGGNPPLSPQSPMASPKPHPPESIESVFGPSFASQPVNDEVPPMSPPIPKRKSFDEADVKPANGQFGANFVSPAKKDSDTRSRTPPRSPGLTDEVVAGTPKIQATSPARGNQSPEEGTSTQNASSSPSHPSFASLERVERAPLSPSNSVASEAAAYRASSGASVTSTTTASSQPSHYRMLTSTAAERKRTVAACRALRAQISRFEEAFMQLHGRAPKGAAERAPLATTYAQYREWKRAIRADAACRIQALFRGASCRWRLLRSNDARMVRVVQNRAGRVSSVAQRVEPKSEEAVMKQLSIPREIDAKERGAPRIVSGNAPTFEDAFSTSTASAPSAPLAPQWSTPGRRSSGGTTSTPPPYASPQGSPSPTGGYGQLSLADLQTRKKELKQQLKQYDMNFFRQHGRMPVKAEKEPIRHLYENYNALKSQIQMMEQEGQHLPPSVVQTQRPSSRSMSPPLGVASAPDSDESPPSASIMRPRRKPKRPSPPLADAVPSQDLASLKAEKQQLHQMLRSYEKDFFREHKRQVSSFADIRPVASQYRRYKEIKKAIANMQQQQGGER